MITEEFDFEEIIRLKPFIVESGLLSSLPHEKFLDFAKSIKKVLIHGGENLITEGEEDPSLFILIQGRLRVFGKNEECIVEITKGQIVGELALLLNEKRTKTVRAIRDSVLLKIDKAAFDFLKNNYPQEIVRMSRTALCRLKKNTRAYYPGEKINVLVIIPSSSSDPKEIADDLFEKIRISRNTLIIKEEDFNQEFRKGSAEFSEQTIAEWMNRLEEEYSFLIYVGDGNDSPWSQRIIRRADRIILVADDQQSVDLNATEQFLFSINESIKPFIDLVIYHPKNTVAITGTTAWLDKRPINIHHHINRGDKEHLERLIRFLTDKAFGVVLSGGAAQALSHLGALRALDELKIPIDFIIGNSMGAILAAGYAAFGTAESLKLTQMAMQAYKPFPTIPLQALLTGKEESQLFQKVWGNLRIEDLWTNFFCVASDIAHFKVVVLNRGEVWKALRTSISVPVILPPIYTSEGQILVDGCILNNLPVDILRRVLGGGYILAVSCAIEKGSHHYYYGEKYSRSGWKLLFDRINPFKKEKVKNHSLISIVMRSFLATTIDQREKLENMADAVLCLENIDTTVRDYQLGDRIIESAYHESKRVLPSLLESYLQANEMKKIESSPRPGTSG